MVLGLAVNDRSGAIISRAESAKHAWLDGELHDHAAFAEEASETFKREAVIDEALGPHPHVLKCLGAAISDKERRERIT